MILIVGLGNPGKKYQNTRHNAGFLALEKFYAAEEGNFSQWKENKKFQALVAESTDKKIKLVLPQTFMNESGVAVGALAQFYKVPSTNIYVVHDDLDLPLGKIKVQIDRSAAGHNGVKSIIEKIGGQNFARFRIGIKPLKETFKEGADLVLAKFSSAEKKDLETGLQKTVEALKEALQNGLAATMNKFN